MITPLLATLVAAVAALFVVGTGDRRRNLREFWSVAAGVLQFGLVASMVPQVMAGFTPEGVLFHLLPGVTIAFRVDGFGLLFALGASLLWIVTSFYSIGYVRTLGEHAQTRYFACFALALSATMGVAFAANLFTLFLFYEALTLATYSLVAHKETPEARAGARKYIIYLLGAAKLLLLPAIVLTYNVAGTLDFRPGGILGAAQVADHPTLLAVVFALFLFGLAKNAVMPLHSWLPAAMVAPTPVSALLHAVAVVKTGVFATLRVFLFVFGTDTMRQLGVDTLALWGGLCHDSSGLGPGSLSGQSESAAGVLDDQPALLHRSGRSAAHQQRDRRRHRPHHQSRGVEDHALFLRRLDLRVRAQDRCQPDVGARQKNAVDDGGVCDRLVEPGGHPSFVGLRLEVVSRPGFG